MKVVCRKIFTFVDSRGRSPFREWLDNISDARAVAAIIQRLDRLSLGNFGDCKSVGGGIYESRIFYGPGFRIYFVVLKDSKLLVLNGGTKRTQVKDINQSKRYLREFKKDGNERSQSIAKE